MAILALDAGTTGITAVVHDQGTPVAKVYAEFTQHHPQPGWVEHDAREIWDTVRRVGKDAVRQAGSPVDAVGFAVQRETIVLWDRTTGKPVAPAIVWQDRRTAARCEELADQAPMIRQKTGLVTDPYFSATKLEWLLDQGHRAAAQRGELAAGTIDSWLAWKATEEHVTDATNASRTMLFNIHEDAWDDELLQLFRVPEQLLPEVVPSSGIVGSTGVFGAEADVAALVGDQQAALFGQGCTEPGQAKNTYGTGCFLLQHTGQAAATSEHGLLTTRAASLDRPQFALEGSVFTGAAAIQWLRDGLQVIPDAPSVNELASQVEDTAVMIVPAFQGLGAPYWDPHAKGAVLGLSAGSTKADLARATLESIAIQSTVLVRAMEADTGHTMPELRADGGAAKSDLLMQMQADFLQRPVHRSANVETTALGAAKLAGLAVDAWDAQREAAPDVFTPGAPQDPKLARWEQAVAAVRAFA